MIKSQIFILFFFIIFGGSSLYAQDDKVIMLDGVVLNDSIETSYLHIINLNMLKGTITNNGGEFTIPVRLNDTLYVSAVQFKHKYISITQEIYERKTLSFYLEEEVSELDEVNISNIELSGRLGDDFKIPEVIDPVDPASEMPFYKGPKLTQEERKLYTATHTGGGLIPVDAVINAISGRTKRLKRHVKVSNMEIKVQDARNIIEDSIYVYQLAIPVELIDDFAHYVFEDNPEALQLAKNNDLLAYMEYLIEKAPEYLKYKEID